MKWMKLDAAEPVDTDDQVPEAEHPAVAPSGKLCRKSERS
jgi:hypothetical protein